MDVSRAAFFGRTTLDVLYFLDQLPTEDTKAFAHAFRAAPGGPACNAGLTHALLGGQTLLFSAIGKGPWAAQVRNELARHNITPIDLAAETEYELPLTTIWVNTRDSTRTIVNPPASAADIPPLPTAWNPQWGATPATALTDGFQLRETLPLLKALHRAGTALIFDGGSWKPGTEELAPLLTAAICSERFTLPGSSADPEATLHWFAAKGVPHTAVTRGPRSILALDRGRHFEIEIQPLPTIASQAADTNGAGDVLHGAFCYHFARSGDFESALRQASESATRSCTAPGIAAWKAH